jgi:predicted helicase
LNDLYVRFFRMAERRIVEKTGAGVVCFISNYSWLDGLSFTAMREKYLEVFDKIWIDNLHGDRIISEYSPDGRTSETVFAIEGKSPGIKIGTSITLMVRKKGDTHTGEVLYRDRQEARAADRRAALLTSLDHGGTYLALEPELRLGLPFKPRAMGADYLSWPLLTELFPTSFPGVKTSRDDVVVDIDKDRLIRRMEQYFDPEISHEEMRQIAPGAMASTARFQAEQTRANLRERGFKPENVVRYCYRPFDTRWLYWEPSTKLLDEKRSDYFPHVSSENVWIEARQKQPMEHFDRGYVTSHLSDNFGNGLSNFFPLYLKGAALPGATAWAPNLSERAESFLSQNGHAAAGLFHHVVSVLHSPFYRRENSGALRQDWPRIPLPASATLLHSSAALGHQVAALLDIEQSVPCVNVSPVRPELRIIGVLTAVSGQLNPDEGDLDLTAGWGHGGKGGVTMPGKGKAVARPYTPAELAAFAGSGGDAAALLGASTYDVYLNGKAFWSNIPSAVWEYTLGGYQVIKK